MPNTEVFHNIAKDCKDSYLAWPKPFLFMKKEPGLKGCTRVFTRVFFVSDDWIFKRGLPWSTGGCPRKARSIPLQVAWGYTDTDYGVAPMVGFPVLGR